MSLWPKRVSKIIRVSLCIDLRRRLWDQTLWFTTLGDSNRWRGSNKYSDLLTRSIYSTIEEKITKSIICDFSVLWSSELVEIAILLAPQKTSSTLKSRERFFGSKNLFVLNLLIFHLFGFRLIQKVQSFFLCKKKVQSY